MEGDSSSTTGSATTGPTSFSDPSLTWSGDSSSSTPSTDSTAAVSPSTDAIDPSAAVSVEGATPATGEPPKERWNDILANARAKATQDAQAQFETQYGWATKVNPQEFQQVQQLARTLSANPIEGLQQLIAEVRKDPRYDAELKSLAARALAHGRGQAQPSGPDLNPIQVQLENGQTVGLYSSDQIAALQQQWLAQVEQRFQPVTQTIETLQAERAAAVHQQQVEHFVTSTYQDVATWPGMESAESRQAVAKELAGARIDPNDPGQVMLAVNAAWRKVIAPTLGQKAQSALLDSLKTKATAATSVNPGASAGATPKRVDSFYDLPKSAWK